MLLLFIRNLKYHRVQFNLSVNNLRKVQMEYYQQEDKNYFIIKNDFEIINLNLLAHPFDLIASA